MLIAEKYSVDGMTKVFFRLATATQVLRDASKAYER
jgi:hypothetical protein